MNSPLNQTMLFTTAPHTLIHNWNAHLTHTRTHWRVHLAAGRSPVMGKCLTHGKQKCVLKEFVRRGLVTRGTLRGCTLQEGRSQMSYAVVWHSNGKQKFVRTSLVSRLFPVFRWVAQTVNKSVCSKSTGDEVVDRCTTCMRWGLNAINICCGRPDTHKYRCG